MAYETILFDIDGTLCDPGISIIESARYALAEMGIEETDEEALRRFVGPPLEHTFSDYYDFDEEKTAMAVSLFRDKIRKDGIQLYKTYDGIPELRLGFFYSSSLPILLQFTEANDPELRRAAVAIIAAMGPFGVPAF